MGAGLNTDRTRGKSKGRGSDDSIIKSTTENTSEKSEDKQETSSPQESSSSQESEQESNSGGRPSKIQNPCRTTLTLEQRHIDDLRQIRASIMGTGGEEISRSAAVRAIFDAVGNADLDYSDVSTKEDLRNLIQGKLGI